jgi:hypothetical protein
MRNSKFITAALLVDSLIGCAGPEGPTIEPIEGREDLELRVYHTRIEGGLSDEVTIDVPDGLESLLLELRGDRGLYYLTKFETPNGELIESAKYMTRFAREVPGLVDWLYPNTPSLSLEAGQHTLMIRGETTTGDRVSEDVEIRLYTKRASSSPGFGIHLDFLVDKRAIAESDIDLAIDSAIDWVNHMYAGTLSDLFPDHPERYPEQRDTGLRVIDYTITPITLPGTGVDVSQTSATKYVDDVLYQARAAQTARDDSLHVIVVNSIGGSEPSGYAMGLPGPFDADRANAAVLISTGAYTDSNNELDVNGMASTLAHEIGHYLGLYHTSESSGTSHDPLADTPQCDGFCADPEFEENIMTSGNGARRYRLSDDQVFVLRQHPLSVPMELP